MGLRQHIVRDRSFLWRERAIISNLMDTARLKCHNAAIDVQLNYLVATMLLLSILYDMINRYDGSITICG